MPRGVVSAKKTTAGVTRRSAQARLPEVLYIKFTREEQTLRFAGGIPRSSGVTLYQIHEEGANRASRFGLKGKFRKYLDFTTTLLGFS